MLDDTVRLVTGMSMNGFKNIEHFDFIIPQYIIWVQCQSSTPGNCRAKELARLGKTIHLSGEFSTVVIPL